MGEGNSKQVLDRGNLSEEEVNILLTKFNLDVNAYGKSKINPSQFCSIFPLILQPYVSQLLPALRDIAKSKTAKKLIKKQNHKILLCMNAMSKGGGVGGVAKASRGLGEGTAMTTLGNGGNAAKSENRRSSTMQMRNESREKENWGGALKAKKNAQSESSEKKKKKKNNGGKSSNAEANNSVFLDVHNYCVSYFSYINYLKHKPKKCRGVITVQELINAVNVCVYGDSNTVDHLLLIGFIYHASPQAKKEKLSWKNAFGSFAHVLLEDDVTSNDKSCRAANFPSALTLRNNSSNNDMKVCFSNASANLRENNNFNFLTNSSGDSQIDSLSPPYNNAASKLYARNSAFSNFYSWNKEDTCANGCTFHDKERRNCDSSSTLKNNSDLFLKDTDNSFLPYAKSTSFTRIEIALRQLVTYAYLESIFLQTPTSPLFSSNPLAFPPPPAFSSSNIFPFKDKEDDEEELPCERMNSWDVAAHFFHNQKINRPPMAFKPLIDSFREYAKGKSKKKVHARLAIEWLNKTLKYLPHTCKLALHYHLVSCPFSASSMMNLAMSDYAEKERNDSFCAYYSKYSYLEKYYERKILEDTILSYKRDQASFCKNKENVEFPVDTAKRMQKNRTGQFHNISCGKTAENIISAELPAPSPSMQKIELETGGWRGLWLCASSRCLTDETCFSLRQCSMLFLPNRWTRLYASWKQGTSFNRCVNAILGYPSPSVVAVKTSNGQVFGGVCTSAWKECGHSYFGTDSGFLFSAFPVFKIFRATGLGENFVYLNMKNQFHPKGLGFGGQPECFRLWLGDEFLDCYATASDKTYEAGNICTSVPQLDFNDLDDILLDKGTSDYFLKKFHVQEVEVWGTGDAMALKIQADVKLNEEQARQEKRGGDKSRFLENEFDKEYLLAGTFSRDKMSALCSV